MKTNFEVRYAAHPNDVKHYDTAKIRENYLVEKIFGADEVNMVYSMHDRIIAGGAMPVHETLELESVDMLRMPYFLSRREMGIFNVGGPGVVIVDGTEHTMDFKEALYLGRGDRKVEFRSSDRGNPARFYFNSAPAHTTYPDKLVTKQTEGVVVMAMGSLEESNQRVINRMMVSQVLPTCQLQMGMTELKPGSTWNTMPAHTHNRRMEVYFYFEVPEGQAVCHFMGEPDETRHIWMKGNQAVVSPEWSIHSACATSNYTFIWGMGGENLDYGDMDGLKTDELK
ncbi:5-dehydro-4-deoxy-D-glucuronate isomerase [uncultured Alistipes sp.]|jgi:4-deoxy-L-threo-5-hexosulose-uronate ketol-isomerase|uniref:5-dehydro-4-deoxy-D-glucuronate isomerase n=1 Tax=uncultured Alistipes sp. TaxID=538949 RepID=UPI0025E16D86|nr:5-dehydro-4-deoxy-D-glucuronate isomerase [uncultured Alistipes sp.]